MVNEHDDLAAQFGALDGGQVAKGADQVVGQFRRNVRSTCSGARPKVSKRQTASIGAESGRLQVVALWGAENGDSTPLAVGHLPLGPASLLAFEFNGRSQW